MREVFTEIMLKNKCTTLNFLSFWYIFRNKQLKIQLFSFCHLNYLSISLRSREYFNKNLAVNERWWNWLIWLKYYPTDLDDYFWFGKVPRLFRSNLLLALEFWRTHIYLLFGRIQHYIHIHVTKQYLYTKAVKLMFFLVEKEICGRGAAKAQQISAKNNHSAKVHTFFYVSAPTGRWQFFSNSSDSSNVSRMTTYHFSWQAG